MEDHSLIIQDNDNDWLQLLEWIQESSDFPAATEVTTESFDFNYIFEKKMVGDEQPASSPSLSRDDACCPPTRCLPSVGGRLDGTTREEAMSIANQTSEKEHVLVPTFHDADSEPTSARTQRTDAEMSTSILKKISNANDKNLLSAESTLTLEEGGLEKRKNHRDRGQQQEQKEQNQDNGGTYAYLQSNTVIASPTAEEVIDEVFQSSNYSVTKNHFLLAKETCAWKEDDNSSFPLVSLVPGDAKEHSDTIVFTGVAGPCHHTRQNTDASEMQTTEGIKGKTSSCVAASPNTEATKVVTPTKQSPLGELVAPSDRERNNDFSMVLAGKKRKAQAQEEDHPGNKSARIGTVQLIGTSGNSHTCAPAIEMKETAESDKENVTKSESPTATCTGAVKRGQDCSDAAAVPAREETKRCQQTTDDVRFLTNDDVRHEDVLCGRGAHATHHSGNQAFREDISQVLEKYIESSRQEKTKIAETIVKKVFQRGGRFLKRVERNGKIPSQCNESDTLWTKRGRRSIYDEDNIWMVLPYLQARMKVSQRFRKEASSTVDLAFEAMCAG